MKSIKKYLLLIILVCIQGAAIALALKAAIGVAAWDAINQSVADVTKILVGTVIIIMNSILIFLQLVILRREFGIKHILQIVVSLIFGVIINFMLTHVYTFEITSYWIRLGLLLMAVTIQGIVAGMVMELDLITFPVEAFCRALSTIIKPTFVQVRQSLDVVSILASIAISIFAKTHLNVREGTVIAMLLFSPIMGLSMKFFEPKFKKWGLKD